MTATTPARRTGGRSAVVAASIKRAVEDLVSERGTDRVTIPMVAERAGVNATTIYRRWGDLPTLINDMATYRLDPARPIPHTGDLRADLRSWAGELAAHYLDPSNAAMLRGGAATAGQADTDCMRNRRAEAAVLVGDDPRVNADQVINHLVAPIIYRVIFMPWTVDDALLDNLVEDFCRLL